MWECEYCGEMNDDDTNECEYCGLSPDVNYGWVGENYGCLYDNMQRLWMPERPFKGHLHRMRIRFVRQSRLGRFR